MKLLLDMNMPVGLCPLLVRAGHEAVHWREYGSPRAEDSEILLWAKRNGYVILTHDLDFGSILASSAGDGQSVVELRMHSGNTAALFSQIIVIIDRFGLQLTEGALVVADTVKQRVRILPL